VPRKNSLIISCNDLRRRVTLRILGVLAPFWAVFAAPLWLSGLRYSLNDKVSLMIACAASLLVCPISTFALLRNKLELNDFFLIFPGILRKRMPIKDLKELSVESGKIIFCFQVPDKSKKESYVQEATERTSKLSIDLHRIKVNERWKLIEFVETKQPSCIISESTRRLIANDDFNESDELTQSLRLPYESHSRLKAFYEILSNYEPTFWKIYAACGVFFFFLVCFPALLCLPFALFERYILNQSYASASFFEDWLRWVQPLIDGTKNAVTPLQWYYDWIDRNQSYTFVIAMAALAVVGRCLWFLARPTELMLTARDFCMNSTNLGVRFMHSGYFRWADCTRVICKSGKEVGKIGEQVLVFEGGSGHLAQVELSGLKRNSRMMLKKALETWAPNAELDASFVETAETAKRESYTELLLRSLNTPPKRDRLTPLSSGDRLKGGDIVVNRMIGAGGQGVAYLADWREPGKSVRSIVVKEFILPVYVDRRARKQALERFEQESNLLSSLDHDNIVSLEDHFIEDHRAYLVLEYIDGKSLRELAKGGLRDELKLRNIVLQMCHILLHLHEQSPPMVHRDFAPDNLILDSSGKLKLIDFNVAHRVANDSKATVVGKHAYMPPEQFAGRPCVQSDLYAMGASLYYILSGTDPEPFSESGLPPDCVDLDPVWGQIIMGCTSLELSRRFKSAAEILALLEPQAHVDSAELQEFRDSANSESAKKDGDEDEGEPESIKIEMPEAING
jgi:tRNA A-37 threonylcarbamoyl transferase component Bud32